MPLAEVILFGYGTAESIMLFMFVRLFFIDRSKPRADVYLPSFLFWFGFVIALGAAVGGFFALSGSHWIYLGVALAVELLGIAAMLCQLNQRIVYISPTVFTYTTFLGRSAQFDIHAITRVRRNGDSITIWVGNKKLHIEAMAVGGSLFAYDAEKYSGCPRFNPSAAKPGIRNSIQMIDGGTGLFILGLLIPLAFIGLGVFLTAVLEEPDVDIASLQTIEIIYADGQRKNDSFYITREDGTQYYIDNISIKAFHSKAFQSVASGTRLYLSYAEGDVSGDGIQHIYSVRSKDTVYLSAEDALRKLQSNTNLGKVMVAVFIAVGVIYIALFLFAMSDAKKHYKLLKFFIRPDHINIPQQRPSGTKRRRRS